MRLWMAFVVANAVACSGRHGARVLPDAAVDAFVIIECNCNPLLQYGCDAGQKCSWVYSGIGPMPVGFVTCVPDGVAPLGGVCTFGPAVPDMYPKSCVSGSYDDCVQGTQCWNGTCERMCDLAGRDVLCPSGKTCVMHDGLLEYGGVYFDGVCE